MAKAKKEAKKASGKSEAKAKKKEKQAHKSEKKSKKAGPADGGSEAEDEDLDAVLAEYERRQKLFLKVTEEVLEGPPRARSAATLLASPASHHHHHQQAQLLLFGGEFFNGSLATFFNDLLVYHVGRDEWRRVTSPNAPLPRSGHAWCRAGNDRDAVYLFGGEFSSPKQGTFYHYNDFWRLDAATKEWARIDTPKGGGGGGGAGGGGGQQQQQQQQQGQGQGKWPPARSGHRMTYFKNYIVLFGGFQDTANQTRYLADLWIYDTQTFAWHSPALPSGQLRPDARSSFTLLPHEQGAVLYGGYSRVTATASMGGGGGGSKKGGGKGKGGGGGGAQHQHQQRGVLKPMVHQDCYFLRITPPKPDEPHGALPTVRWERRKRPANAPNPARAGATMAHHRGRGILFGGVRDVEESEEGIDSEFFNQLYAWNIERNRFFPLALRKPRAVTAANRKGGVGGGGGEQKMSRRARAQANEEELLSQLAALQAVASGDVDSMMADDDDADHEDMDLEMLKKGAAAGGAKDEPGERKPAREMPVSMELPHPRFNAQLAVLDDVLYIYGGTFEKGDREFTFDDLYAIDLGKMDGCKEIFSVPVEDWVASESEDEDDEDDYEDDDGGDEEEDEKDEEGDIQMADEAQKLLSPSKRRKKQNDKQGTGEEMNASILHSPVSTPAPSVMSSVDDEDDDADTTATSVFDDGLPHPRPFESRRDFFQRTSAEWQEVLMASLRCKGAKPEALGVKEIKARAFELSEEKWWDCREEVLALEEEQEEAGIGEVVSLADARGGGGGRGGGVVGRRR